MYHLLKEWSQVFPSPVDSLEMYHLLKEWSQVFPSPVDSLEMYHLLKEWSQFNRSFPLSSSFAPDVSCNLDLFLT
ncbi:hypothetical protein E2562_017355 [Oryza meyeriana var. granulata]|uniref:Uncharacterized protein n=1 Tax=Oryza meyeriana var. granulata TaxID=110450 RepID=A0A6G1D5I8_9ORYZ|nr:hypothetical protein E2562_017355 [Oryza meyeriana var. granulata]